MVAQDASNLRAVLLLADCRSQLGQDAGVVELLAPREADFKDDRLYAYLLGNALLRRNEILRGQALVDRLFKGGETAEARLLMGVAHLQRGDFRAAVPELERAVALNAALAGAQSLLGRALMGAGRRDDAIKAFTAELTRNPNDFDANLYLGIMLKDDGKLDEAHEHLKRAQRLRSRDVAVQYALGALHLAAGRTEEARQGAGDRDRGIAGLPARARPPGHRVLPAEGQGEGRPRAGPGREAEGGRAGAGARRVRSVAPSERSGNPAVTAPVLAALLMTAGAPVSFDALSAKAVEARVAGRLEEAAGHYAEALALRPAWAEGRLALGDHPLRPEAIPRRRGTISSGSPPPERGAVRRGRSSGLAASRLREDEAALAALGRARTLEIASNEMRSRVQFETALLLNRTGNTMRLSTSCARTRAKDRTAPP